MSTTVLTGAAAADTVRADNVPSAHNPDGLFDPSPLGFSHVVVTGSGRLAFIAGQGGERADGALPTTFDAQAAQAFANLNAAIAAVGATPRQVVKLTTYIVDHDEARLAEMSRHLRTMFGDWRPAQTLVPVPRLALDGMLFEVDAVVLLSPDGEPRKTPN